MNIYTYTPLTAYQALLPMIRHLSNILHAILAAECRARFHFLSTTQKL